MERVAGGVMPAGSEFLSVRVKFHTSAPGEFGEGEIHSMRLERLAALPTTPAGKRLSLFNFNIAKMRHDWKGWIRYVEQQRLRPPDIVLLQDVENDAEREQLQSGLGEAFGGSWAGVEHETLRGRGRVDFLLLRTASKTAPAVVRQMTLPLGNASGIKWSDHRSIHAEIAY